MSFSCTRKEGTHGEGFQTAEGSLVSIQWGKVLFKGSKWYGVGISTNFADRRPRALTTKIREIQKAAHKGTENLSKANYLKTLAGEMLKTSKRTARDGRLGCKETYFQYEKWPKIRALASHGTGTSAFGPTAICDLPLRVRHAPPCQDSRPEKGPQPVLWMSEVRIVAAENVEAGDIPGMGQDVEALQT